MLRGCAEVGALIANPERSIRLINKAKIKMILFVNIESLKAAKT